MGDEEDDPPLTIETTIAIKIIAPMIAKIVSMICISISPLSNNQSFRTDLIITKRVSICKGGKTNNTLPNNLNYVILQSLN